MQQLSLFDQIKILQEETAPVEVDLSTLEKVYYTITEVAEMFQVNASLLRFWEKEFPAQLAGVKKNKKGDRYYNKQDLEKLKFIFHVVRDKKMTLEGARDYLKNNKKKAKDDKTLIENLQTVRTFLIELKNSLKQTS